MENGAAPTFDHCGEVLRSISFGSEKRLLSITDTDIDRMISAGKDMRSSFANGTKMYKHPWSLIRQSKKTCALRKKMGKALIYGAGIDVGKEIAITEDFSLSTLGTILDMHPDSYPGVMKPQFFVGFPHSCFCLHTEDAALWSASYLYFGAIKLW